MPDGNKTMGGGKMTLEGTNLNFKNSFSVLSNEEIISISDMMGVHINDCDFSAINLIKDLEVARHSLEEKNKINMPTSVEVEIEIEEIDDELSDLEKIVEITPKRKANPVKRLSLSGPRKKNKE